MLRVSNTLLTSLKDQVRGARYSIRAEAAAPGSGLPKLVRDSFGPLVMMGSIVSTPAARLADSILTRVETLATDVLTPGADDHAMFPRPVGDYFAAEDENRVSFSERLYVPVKAMLQAHGVRNMLVSQQALDVAWTGIRTRHGEKISTGSDMAKVGDLVDVCADMAIAFVEARPIRKVEFEDVSRVKPNFMISPNLYCGLVIGLATAVVTLDPDLGSDGDAVVESADSAVDARLARFKQAMGERAPVEGLTREFRAILPYLP